MSDAFRVSQREPYKHNDQIGQKIIIFMQKWGEIVSSLCCEPGTWVNIQGKWLVGECWDLSVSVYSECIRLVDAAYGIPVHSFLIPLKRQNETMYYCLDDGWGQTCRLSIRLAILSYAGNWMTLNTLQLKNKLLMRTRWQKINN